VPATSHAKQGVGRWFGGARTRAGIYSEHAAAEKCSPKANVRYPVPGAISILASVILTGVILFVEVAKKLSGSIPIWTFGML